ncbi:hypothetical protein [Staphylococcus caledonicus]|uniref:hypothetical protein n=1 Tax=Staphylococcus caledonicus TaxID=2741333 RepID=UPI0018E45C47|nr:hypothetical protein [Staphylococcus caledonicus]MBI5973912.1 hypothetical protein [Staphylococcus caledonicus]
MHNQENKISQYKDKWINVQFNAIEKEEDFYLFTTLHNDKDDYYINIGHLGIKYEGSSQWKIIDFEIDRQYRGQNYGAAMLVEALEGVTKLSNTQNIYLYGEISSVYIEDRNNYMDINESLGYKKLKMFYQKLGFTFEDDINFYKHTSVEAVPDWQQVMKYSMEIEELKVEIAFKDIILEAYEKSRYQMQSSFLGRLLLKKFEDKKVR